MTRFYPSILILVLIATGVGTTSGRGLRHNPSALAQGLIGPGGLDQPHLNSVQLLFRGQPVDQVISGKKIKKYSLDVTGTGFVAGSTVVVNSIRAYPTTIGAPQQPVSTGFESATTLTASFLPGPPPPPGLFLVKIVNPGGVESDPATIDIISKPSELSITSISPESGPIGTEVTVTGTGFTAAGSPLQTAIRFSADGSNSRFFEGFYNNHILGSDRLSLVVPDRVILPICPGSLIACDPIAIPAVSPQQYRIWVINPNGMSNGVLFRVTSKSVP